MDGTDFTQTKRAHEGPWLETKPLLKAGSGLDKAGAKDFAGIADEDEGLGIHGFDMAPQGEGLRAVQGREDDGFFLLGEGALSLP